jgi:gamma-glutamyl:cysteine ligase YbdK (ATP-grasp superfamily)
MVAPGTSVAGANAEIRTAMEKLREVIAETGSNKAATNAMANLAEAIQGLVQNMRSEQQMIRNWADAQADQHGQIKRLLEMLMRERALPVQPQQPSPPQPAREKEEA